MANCPICKQPFRNRFDKARPTGGRWVHPQCAPVEAKNVQAAAASAEAAGPWLPLPVPASVEDEAALRAPQRPRVEMVPGTSYSTEDI
jgi:hypothetical protein